MHIEILPRLPCIEVLRRLRAGRLACARADQPYVVPFYFACDDNYIYGFSNAGKKIEWMRSNPMVCVQADEGNSNDTWTSVVAFGRFEELPDTDDWRVARETAWSLLQQRAQWWEPGSVKPIGAGVANNVTAVLYRIEILELSGRRATREQNVAADLVHAAVLKPKPERKTWLQGLISKIAWMH